MFDIQSEMQKLKINVEFNIKKYCKKNIPDDLIKSFRTDNWLLTFPFNFTCAFEEESELIRKIAVINCLYLGTFLKEDFLLDDYNVEHDVFGEGVRSYCYSRLLNILAMRQYVYHCGEIILKYLFSYEEIYYSSLFKEKNIANINLNEAFVPKNILFLGQKLLPLVTSFAGYCIIKDKESFIPKCEEMIINYHIAKQLYDDLTDLKNDFYKPDQSYLIKLIAGVNRNCIVNLGEAYEVIMSKKLDILIMENMRKYLKTALLKSEELKFEIFMQEILLLTNLVEDYKRN